MKEVQADQVFGDIFHMVLDAVITSRYDLLMLAIGLASYGCLCSARTRYELKQAKNVDSYAKESTAQCDQQYYEGLLATHVANGNHAQVEGLIASMEEEKVFLREETINSLLTKCIRSSDSQMATILVKLVKAQATCTSDTTYGLLIDALESNHQAAQAMVTEVLDRSIDSVFGFDLVWSILGFCRIFATDRHMADKLLAHIKASDVDALTELVHFYIDISQFDKACDVFERHFATFCNADLGQDTEWSLMHAALKCRRVSVANHLFETSQMNTARHVLKIQAWWKVARQGREQHVGEVFGRLANVFNERFALEEDSDADSGDESTMFLGDDSDRDNDFDSDCDEHEWSSSYSAYSFQHECDSAYSFRM